MGLRIDHIMEENKICKWIGDGEMCKNHSLYRKSYCERHYILVYDVYLTEMADYVLDKEVDAD